MSDFDQKADQEAKKALVLSEISKRCHSNNNAECDHLRAIGQTLESGDSLVCKIIAGGKTNYSYKVFCANNPSLAVYAKISFSYALWNPDKSQEYDLQRAVNEFKIVQQFVSMIHPEKAPVAQPYFLADISDGTAQMKLVVTEWAATSEQWAAEFTEGHVNAQISEQLARTLGKLNLQTIEPSFNENIRPCFRSLFGTLETRFAEILLDVNNKKDDDMAISFMQSMGSDIYHIITQNMDREFMNVRDVICHNDSHQFNILISGLPQDDDDNTTAKDNGFVICDWEMAICGPVGRDAGLTMPFPIACAMCHAIQGRREEAFEIVGLTIQFWDTYSQVLQEGGNDEAYLRKAFLSALGVCGFYLFGVFYLLGIFAEFLPLEGAPHHHRKKAISAFAKVGLELLWVAYGGKGEGMDYASVRDHYKQLVTEHIEICLPVQESGNKPVPRRQSILRTAQRRVSDAFLADEAVFRTSSAKGGARRASIYDVEALALSQEFQEETENIEHARS